MFFHFNPGAGVSLPDNPELWSERGDFGLRMAMSGWWIGLFSPAGMIAGLPVIGGMLTSSHEWHRLLGAGAHHHAFWLPFVLASGIVGAKRIPDGKGPLLLIVFGAIAFPWVGPRTGPTHLKDLANQVPPADAVAADYDTIHLVSGRDTLWNVDQLIMPDKPIHWNDTWPIALDSIDWMLMSVDHPLSAKTSDWQVAASSGTHVLLQRPGQTDRPSP
jgi:MFS family permease